MMEGSHAGEELYLGATSYELLVLRAFSKGGRNRGSHECRCMRSLPRTQHSRPNRFNHSSCCQARYVLQGAGASSKSVRDRRGGGDGGNASETP